jgi:redox-sensing transcriptional repressor
VSRRISDPAIRRLSLYLRALEALTESGVPTVSSAELADRAGTTAAHVRKDLSAFGSFGTRGLGYPVAPLLDRVRGILGLDRRWAVALVGAGRIGSALFAYPRFRERGFEIVAIFDEDPLKVGESLEGCRIESVSALESTIRARAVEIVILAVPAPAAQAVADRAVAAGVRGILNFAPVRLKAPPAIFVNDVNLAMELEGLSHALRTPAPQTPASRTPSA